MPDTRTHRGPHPEDRLLFAPEQWPRLQAAAEDLSWLLERAYPVTSALALVGNRHQLTARQRTAVERCTCGASVARSRGARRVGAAALRGQPLWLDGYNVLLTVEVALGGGLVLHAEDGAYRDLASVHGTYRAVAETVPALERLGEAFTDLGSSAWTWWLDRPVSNSGRLKTEIERVAAAHGWPWTVELVNNPDAVLAASTEVVATADSAILDANVRWFNLTRHVLATLSPTPWILPLPANGAS